MTDLKIPKDKKLDSIDDYEIIKEIKSGAYGKVFLAEDKSTKHKVAIKEPVKGNPNSVRSLKIEAKIISNCHHPSIQLLIGYHHDRTNDEYRMITPYYEKGSLADLIFSDNYIEDDVKSFNIAFGIASAMRYLHKNNISHRDLKPGNILLDDDNLPILIDFGIARRDINKMETPIGTYNYLAPEVFTDDAYNEKVDVYSFGMILLEMYTKRLTFDKISWDKMIQIKSDNRIQIDDNISMPGFLEKIVYKCLDPNPSSRIGFNEILLLLKANVNSLINSHLSNKYIKYLGYTKKQILFYRIPKQLFKEIKDQYDDDDDINKLIDWECLEKMFESSKDKKILLIIILGPYGKGKSTLLKNLTGNQAFKCGNCENETTMGLYIDGYYTINDIKKQIRTKPNQKKDHGLEYSKLFDTLNLDDSYHIYFLDSQGIGGPKYNKNKEVLDKINSIFCASSSVCISIQDSTTDSSLKSVFQLARGVQFSTPTKQFFLMRNYGTFNNLSNLSFESLVDFHKNNMNNYIKPRLPIMEFYDINNIMLLGFGDMGNMDCFFISIWFSFYMICTKITKDNIFTSNGTINYLKAKTNLFFGDLFRKYNKFIFNPPSELSFNSTILPDSNEKNTNVNRLCVLSYYWSLDNILNYCYTPNIKIDEMISNVTLFIENNVKIFFPYIISQTECSYYNFVQYINQITYDLISSAEYEIQKIFKKNLFAPGNFIITSGTMLLTAYSPIPYIQVSSATIYILSVIANSYLNRKVSINYLINNFRYSNYPFIWCKTIKGLAMNNFTFSKKKYSGFSILSDFILEKMNFTNKSNNTNNKNDDNDNNTNDVNDDNSNNKKEKNDDNDNNTNDVNDDNNNNTNDENDDNSNNKKEKNDDDDNNKKDDNSNNKKEKNDNTNITLCSFDIDTDFYLLMQQVNANKNIDKNITKNIPKQIVETQNYLSSILDNYQLVIFFEQNMNNKSSLIFKALSGIDVVLENKKQIKISSDSINTQSLLARIKRFGLDQPYKNRNLKFIYMKGYNANEINELYDYFEIKPILISSMKENDQLSIIPKDTSRFYLFYLSKNFYQQICLEIYKKKPKWDYFIVTDKSINEIFNNEKIDQLKQSLKIPSANIIPINSDIYDFGEFESITQALIQYGCLSILQRIIK